MSARVFIAAPKAPPPNGWRRKGTGSVVALQLGAVHDRRHKDIKMEVGHFYSLKLRTHTLRHLVAGEGLHERDVSALKRVKPNGLRLKLLYASP